MASMGKPTEDDQLGAVSGAAGSYEHAGGSEQFGSASTRRRVTQVLLYALLIIGALLAIFPMVWMLSASLMPTGEASTYPPHLIPSRVTFSHYADLFTRLNLGRYLFNSTLIAVTVTAISLVVNSMAGYAFAKLRFRGRDRTFRPRNLNLANAYPAIEFTTSEIAVTVTAISVLLNKYRPRLSRVKRSA